MTVPPDDELREFWERLLMVLEDATSTAQFLYDATLNGPGGRRRPRPALPAGGRWGLRARARARGRPSFRIPGGGDHGVLEAQAGA